VSTAIARSAARIPLPRLLAFSLGSIPATMLVTMMGVYLPPFYAGHLGVSLLAIGGTIASVRLADLGVDLLLGWLMDKTRTPVGRYKPWFALGLPILWLAVYKVFNPPNDADVGYLFVWYLILYVAYSILMLSHSAWGATLSGNYHERSRVFGWMMGTAVLGSAALQATPLITHGAIKPGDPASLGVLGLIIIVVASLAIPIALIFGSERIAAAPGKRPTLKDYMAVVRQPSMMRLVAADLLLTLGPGTTAPIYLFFFHEAKGFSLTHVAILLIPYTAAGIFGAPFWGRVAQRFGKHRTVQIAAVCYAVTQTTLMLIPQNLFWPTFAGMFSVGFCGSAFLLLIRAMVADVADQLRLETGQERSGVLFALVTMTQKFGSSITVSIIYPILAIVGFNPKPGAINTPHAIWGLEMCYLFAPIALVLVGATLFFGYKLDAKKQSEIRAELDAMEARDYAAAEESLLGPGETIAPVR
jgi:GPH family glycoside/pentoside/hexuronide:cation symporter